MLKFITSRNNPRILTAASLSRKKGRDETGLFMLEGKKLLEEAIKSGAPLTDVFCTEKQVEYCLSLKPECDVTCVSEQVFLKISTEKSPQGIISLSKHIDKTCNLDKIFIERDFTDNHSVFVLCGVQDPGNVGTIVRTAAAAGIGELILSDDCADVYSPRAVRASMGAIFRQKIAYASSLSNAIDILKKNGYSIYASVLDKKAVSIDSIDCTGKTVFIVGNEGHGIPNEIVSAAGHTVYIPMKNGVESLNVSAAATIFMWSCRQKQ
ncbi:MAG: RNA methyltransferase [Clostridia bacterium]|nr:RNA methyltransferase [Clostridia bacterium]